MHGFWIRYSLSFAITCLAGCGNSQPPIAPAGGFKEEKVSYEPPDNPGAKAISLPDVDIAETPGRASVVDQPLAVRKGEPIAFEGTARYFDPEKKSLGFKLEMKKPGKAGDAITADAIKVVERDGDEFHYRIQIKAPPETGEHSFALRVIYPPKPETTELQIADLVTGKVQVTAK